jgi:hypothetical protein
MRNKNGEVLSDQTPAEAPKLAPDFLVRGDPLAARLSRWRWGPLGFFSLALILGLIHAVALPWLYGHWRTVGGVIGAWDDWPNLVIVLIMAPLIAGYYVQQPGLILALQTKVLERAKGNLQQEAQELAHWLGWPGWTWIAAGVAVLMDLSSVNDLRHLAIPTWQSANEVMIWSLQPLRFITFYVLVLILVRHVLTLGNLNHLITTIPIEIAPPHPDGAGGLRFVGDYVLTFGLLAMIVSLNFGMTLLRGHTNPAVVTTEYYAELIFYIMVVPPLFFLPLWNVHVRMEAAKKRLLAEIAEQFDQEYRALFDNLRRNVLDPESVVRLEAVQKIYHIAHAAPDWPFNLVIVSQLGAAVFLPILAPLGVSLLANWLSAR